MTASLIFRPALMGAALLALSACATVPPPSGEVNPIDPYEGWNRKVFEFNRSVDKAVLRPVAKGYQTVVPKPVRQGVTNVLKNIQLPWTLLNDLLQGEFGRAKSSFDRFLLNTVFGIGGIFDVASDAGIESHTEDFGQTLAVWGIKPGSYLILPFFGPSSPRDFVGFGVDFVADPGVFALREADAASIPVRVGYFSLSVTDKRYRADEVIEAVYLERDPYVFMRSAWLQNRAFEISNGRIKQNTDEPDLFDELEEDDTEE